MSTEKKTTFGYEVRLGEGERSKQTLTACNLLYSRLCELHDDGVLSNYAFAMVRAALMLIEAVVVPKYSLMTPFGAKEQLDSDYSRFNDMENLPF